MIKKTVDRHKSGIYKITNLVTGYIYIGGSKEVYNRYHTHKCKLKKKVHSCKLLEEDYYKYGFDNFLFEVIEYCNIENIEDKEQYYNNLYKPYYNKREIVNLNIGISQSEETRKKISETLKRRYKDGEIVAYNQSHKFRIIQKINEKGDVVAEYNSLGEADEKHCFPISTLSNVCNRKNNFYGGFYWKYKESSPVKIGLKLESPEVDNQLPNTESVNSTVKV